MKKQPQPRYRPDHTDFLFGPRIYADALRAEREARDAELDSIDPGFPDGCCDGSLADQLEHVIAPDYMMAYAGAVVSGTIAGGRGSNPDVLEVPHPEGSVAEARIAWARG